MDSKFIPGDYVKYQNDVYLVKTVILMNPSVVTDPFVCGLVPVFRSSNMSYWEQLLVRESLLHKVEPPINEKSARMLYEN